MRIAYTLTVQKNEQEISCRLRNLQQEITCWLSQLLSKVIVASCSFYISVQCVDLAAGRRTLKMCCCRSLFNFTAVLLLWQCYYTFYSDSYSEKRFENWSIFGEVKAYTIKCVILGHPVLVLVHRVIIYDFNHFIGQRHCSNGNYTVSGFNEHSWNATAAANWHAYRKVNRPTWILDHVNQLQVMREVNMFGCICRVDWRNKRNFLWKRLYGLFLTTVPYFSVRKYALGARSWSNVNQLWTSEKSYDIWKPRRSLYDVECYSMGSYPCDMTLATILYYAETTLLKTWTLCHKVGLYI